jgi:GntR family transcriptional regulator
VLRKSSFPLYHQLKDLLTEKIENAEWEAGYKLPSEAELSAEFGVSRITVRQAMQLLENSGMVERKRGLGTYVGRPKVSHDLLAIFQNGAGILKTGGTPHVRVHSMRITAGPAYVRSKLGLKAGQDLYELHRTILADDEPLFLFKSWFPTHLFPGLTGKDLETRTVPAVLADYNVVVTHQHKEVEVTILDLEEATFLGTSPGAPSLLVTYLSYMRDREAFEYRRMLVRGDRCKYYVDLDRPEQLV